MENDGFTPLKKVTESDFRFKASHLWHPASKSVKKRLFYTDIAEIVRWGPNYKKEPPGPSPSLKIRYFCCFVFLGLLGPWKDFFWPRDPTPPFMKLRTPGRTPPPSTKLGVTWWLGTTSVWTARQRSQWILWYIYHPWGDGTCRTRPCGMDK